MLVWLVACAESQKPPPDAADTAADTAPDDTGGDTDTAPPDDTAPDTDTADCVPTAKVDDDCDGVDDDCDGSVDEEGPLELLYDDADGDGFGGGEATPRCAGTPGTSADGGDCNDRHATAYPGAVEIADNAVDDDCDGAGDGWIAEDVARWTDDGIGREYYNGSGALALFGDVDGDSDPDVFVGSPLADRDIGNVSVLPYSTGRGGIGHASTAEGGGLGTAFAFLGEPAGKAFYAMGAPFESGSAGHAWVFSWEAFAGVYLQGREAGAQAGAALATTDLDGDGIVDLLVGAPFGAEGAGQVFAVAADDIVTASAWESAQVPLEDMAWGDIRGVGGTGAALGAGDLDGDGYGDVVACGGGACLWVPGTAWPGGSGSGEALATATLRGDCEGAALTTGDFDADGIADLAVGMPAHDGNRGAVSIWPFTARPTGEVSLADAPVFLTGTGALGASIAATDDQDGDGLADLLVGAPGAEGNGRAWLVTNRVSGDILRAAGGYWGGSNAGDRFGERVAFGADLDGDGTSELAVSAPTYSPASYPAPGIVYFLPAFR